MDISNIHRDIIKFLKHHKILISAEHKRNLKRMRRKLVRIYIRSSKIRKSSIRTRRLYSRGAESNTLLSSLLDTRLSFRRQPECMPA